MEDDTEDDTEDDLDHRRVRRALLCFHLATLPRFDLARELYSDSRRAGQGGRPMPPAVAKRLADPRTTEAVAAELERAPRRGVSVVTLEDAAYPSRLVELPEQPLALFVKAADSGSNGAWCSAERAAVAIIGTRKPTPYGLRQARRFATELARAGVSVISGLARGIDSEAHRAAVEAGGITVAVLGAGLGRMYPPEHARLAAQIVATGGALLTPFPYDVPPRAHHFPIRNAILSGLADVVLVVEAAERSGTLITVEHALRQNRTVFAVPGRVDSAESLGCLRLIADGALLAIHPEDVLLALFGSTGAATTTPTGERPISPGDEAAGSSQLRGAAARIEALLLAEDAVHPDEIAASLGTDPAELRVTLAEMETTGTLRRLPGGRFARR